MSKDRSRLGVISIAIFLTASYLILSERAHSLIYIISLNFNIAIIFSWIGFSIFAGIIISILSFFIALAGILRSGCYNAAFLPTTFILTALIGYGHWKIIKKEEYSFRLNSEKLDEEINMLSDSIKKKKNNKEYLESKLLRYLVLKDVTEVLTTTLTLEEIAALIIEKTAGTINKEGRILLFLVDVEKQELMLSASQGMLKVKAKKGDIFDRWVLKHGTPLIVEDVTEDFRFSSADTADAKESFRSLISVPLLSRNKVIGVLRMDSPKEGLYAQDDLRFLDIIGGLGAVAIQNAFLYSWVQDLAIRDSLTGLFVRRYFMKRFEGEIQRAARKNGTLSLLMLDIDRFKWYNDKYGHATGDLVLKHITSIISGSLREDDMAARYGGEEIAVLLADTDKKKGEKKAEAIRKRIEDNPLVIRREAHNVTASIGISSYPEDSVLEEELVRKSDERLYRAKSQGRNRVCAD